LLKDTASGQEDTLPSRRNDIPFDLGVDTSSSKHLRQRRVFHCVEVELVAQIRRCSSSSPAAAQPRLECGVIGLRLKDSNPILPTIRV
jgi:hypothetical protein